MSTPITITINAQTGAATANINEFVSGLQGGLKDIARMFNTARDAAAGFLAYDTLKKFADKALEARQESAKLEAALRSTGQYSQEYQDKLEGIAGALTSVTGTSKDTILAVERTLVSFGTTGDKIESTTKLVLDIAAAMGTDAVSAALLFGRAMDGETVAFGRYRLEIDQSVPLIERRAQAIALLQQKFGGQARAQFAAGIPEVKEFQAVLASAEKQVGEYALKVSAAFLGPIVGGLHTTTAESARVKANLQTAGNAAATAAGAIGDFVAHNPQLAEMGVTLGIIYKLFGQIYGVVPVIGAALAGWGVGSALGDTAPVKSVLDKATAGVMMAWEHIKAMAAINLVGAGSKQADEIKRTRDDAIREWTRFGNQQSPESGNVAPKAKATFGLQADDFQQLLQQSMANQKQQALIAQNRLISAKAVADAELKIKHATLEAEAAMNEASYAKDTLSLKDYFAQRTSLVQQEGDLEVSQKQKQLDHLNGLLATLNPDSKEYNETLKEQATLNAEVVAMREKLKEKLLSIDAEQFQAEKELNDKAQAQTLANLQARRELIENNPWKSDYDKAKQTVDLMEQESAELVKQIAYQKQLTTSANKDVRLDAEAKMNALLKQQSDLRFKLIDAQDPTHFGGFRGSLREGTKPGPTGRELIEPYKQLDDFLKNSLQTTFDGISSAISGVIVGTRTWAQVEMQVVDSIVSGLVSMLLEYTIFHQVRMMLDRVFFTQNAALKTAEVGTHVAGEATKTAATGAGASSRGSIHIAETIVHGVQVAIRTAAHVAGELAMTVITLAQSAVRVGAIIAESIVYVIEAAVKAMSAVADIPYVGPVLAIAALGAVMAAGIGAVGGAGKRELGGQVLGGSPYLVGERGPELFVPGITGSIVTTGSTSRILDAVNSGDGGSGSGTTLNAILFDSKAAYEKWTLTEGKKHILHIVKTNKRELGIQS